MSNIHHFSTINGDLVSNKSSKKLIYDDFRIKNKQYFIMNEL